MEMNVLQTATLEDLLDELCSRSRSVAVAITPAVQEAADADEVSFRLRGDLMQRSGLIQALASAQELSIVDWLSQ